MTDINKLNLIKKPKKLTILKFFDSTFAKKSKFKWDFISNYTSIEKWNLLAEQFDQYVYNNKIFNNKEIQTPKIIHQIWLGPKHLPKKYKLWIKSWLRINPSWKYILWDDKKVADFGLKNQTIFNMSNNYGFKSDIARYEILYKYGGLYADTDFECIKSIPNNLLNYDFVAGCTFNNKPEISNALIIAKPKALILKKLINSIKPLSKNTPKYVFITSGPELLTDIFFKLNEKEKSKCLILPSDYFYPFPSFLLDNKKCEVKEFISKDTIALHYWGMSWFKDSFLKSFFKSIYKFSKMNKVKRFLINFKENLKTNFI